MTLLVTACAVFGLAGPGAKRAATLATVDDDGVECPDATHATIQSVVDPVPAGEGGTIVVCAGAYDELVAVTGKGTICLTGVGDPVLMPPGPTGDGRLIDVSSSRT